MELGPDEELFPLGVTVAEAPPVGIQNVRLQPGLNVLYGKNGSGKTTILEAVKRQLMGWSRTEAMDAGYSDPRLSLYTSGGIHVRRSPSPHRRPPYNGDGPLPTYYTAEDPLAPADSTRVQDQPGFAWQKYDWDAWISAFLMSEPWSVTPRVKSHRWHSFFRAQELGLSKAEWIWLLDQDRFLIKPSDGRIFLCDPEPYFGPLRDHWLRSQTAWARQFEIHPELKSAEKKISWTPDEQTWMIPDFFESGDKGLLCPLPEILGLAPFPDWVAYPVLEIDIQALWLPKLDSLFEVEDVRTEFKWSPLEDTLIDHLAFHERQFMSPNITQLLTGEKTRFENLSDVCRDLEQRVNARLAKLFRDSPRIRISDTRKKTLSRDAPLVVSAQVDPDGPWFPVSGLGDAHRRFIMKVISIELFLDNASGLKSKVAKRVWDQNPFLRPRFYDEGPAMNQLLQIPSPSFAFIDEPERGLHSSAEAYLAEGIGDLSDYVLATSHSLKILNFGLKRGCASLVERDEVGNFQIATSVPAMSSKLVGALEMNLGIEPADLVSLISAFVLVEGVHDARVLEHFLAAFLKQHRIEIIPMQGTKGVEDLVTSPFLFAATSAPIIVVLDNGRQEEVRKLLQEIRQVPDRETRKKIQNKYIKQFDTKEMKAILNLIGQAIEGDKLERVHPFAMSKRDIIDYIPIKNFSDKFESWEEADKHFLESMKRAFFKPGDGRLRKTWLTSKGISCTEAGIRQALKKGAANEDPRHRDFVDLEELLLRVAR